MAEEASVGKGGEEPPPGPAPTALPLTGSVSGLAGRSPVPVESTRSERTSSERTNTLRRGRKAVKGLLGMGRSVWGPEKTVAGRSLKSILMEAGSVMSQDRLMRLAQWLRSHLTVPV